MNSLATKKEVYANLRPDLQKAYDNTSECFGLEFDVKDETCMSQCADAKDCREIFEAVEDVPNADISKQDSQESFPEDVSNQQEPIMEDESMSDEQNDVKAVAEAPKEAPDVATKDAKETPDVATKDATEAPDVATKDAKEGKEKAKGFGDRTAKKDDFGFTLESKGAFIASMLQEGLPTKVEMTAAADEKFGGKSMGRVNMVLYKMKERGFQVQRLGRQYYIENVTPQELVDKVVLTMETATNKKIAEKEKVAQEKATKIAEKAAAEKAKAEAGKSGDTPEPKPETEDQSPPTSQG